MYMYSNFIARAVGVLKYVVPLFSDTNLCIVDPTFDMYVFIHCKPAVVKDLLLIKLGLGHRSLFKKVPNLSTTHWSSKFITLCFQEKRMYEEGGSEYML